MIKRQNMLFVFGVLTFILFTLITLQFNPNFAAARADSIPYLKMFNQFSWKVPLIPLQDYKVATSPIYVCLIGVIQILCGSSFIGVIHLLYFGSALASIYFFIKILKSDSFFQNLPFVILFSSSGYFVAPAIWPTSDAPSVLFAVLTIYMFKQRRNFAFALASFLLVSTRQSFAWYLIAIFAYECLVEVKSLNSFIRKIVKYIPALLSMMVTFFYFDRHMAIPIYLSSQWKSSYPLPNFLNSIQIGITSLSILGATTLLLNRKSLKFRFKKSFFLVLICISAFPGIFLAIHSTEPLIEGLGWISLLSMQLHFSLIVIVVIASVGLILTFFLGFQNDSAKFNLPITLFVSLLLFTLVVPIPYLRYFEFSIILISSMLVGELSDRLLTIGKRKFFALTIFFLILNALKILS